MFDDTRSCHTPYCILCLSKFLQIDLKWKPLVKHAVKKMSHGGKQIKENLKLLHIALKVVVVTLMRGGRLLEVPNPSSKYYTCQLCLRVENFDLTPTHACGPISHAWLKNVSCCRLAWHNFQKYVTSDPCKERKPCVKWINDNTFLTISDFWIEKYWERARVYMCPKTGTGKCRLWTSSEDFGRLLKTSDFFGNLRKWSSRIQKSEHSQDKNSHAYISEKVGRYKI